MRHTHRQTIFAENALVLSHDHVAGEQHILRVEAPKAARHATPGSFAHVQCGNQMPMRRPLSIMRADPDAGWVEFLYKTVGTGTAELARRLTGDTISMLGPIGRGFAPSPDRLRPVLIGGGVGIPPMVFLADHLRRRLNHSQPMVFMGSEIPFPFHSKPSEILVDGMPSEAIACLPLLDDWGVPSRLASQQGFPGCYEGFVTDLARQWLTNLDSRARSEIEIFACGPVPMLKASAKLADEFHLPAQLSLEEFMACAVGGCAGCVVPAHGPNGVEMKRVCVDGPVFEARSIYPQIQARGSSRE